MPGVAPGQEIALQPRRVAFLTIGQTPRPDITSEMSALVGEPFEVHEFGALDGLSRAEVAARAPVGNEAHLYTLLATGEHAVVSHAFIVARLEQLIADVADAGFDLLVILSTGIFQDIASAVPMIHGQRAVDAWIAALMGGNCHIGVIFPLKQQARQSPAVAGYGALVQNASSLSYSGESDRLEDAARMLHSADLILMHSVGYTEARARELALATGKPVVTARRVIAAALRQRLLEARPAPQPASAGRDLMRRLAEPAEKLTPREREVLILALDGHSNKSAARILNISHRTVELHRSHVLAKFGAASAAELIRRALMHPAR